MTSPATAITHTPPALKWLLNERAMLLGEIQRAEAELMALLATQDRLFHLKYQVAALDKAIGLLDDRVCPEASGVVRAWANRYGPRGGLKEFLLWQLDRAGEQGIDTVTLTKRVAERFGLPIGTPRQFRMLRQDQVGRALRRLKADDLAETVLQSTGGGRTPSVWRAKRGQLTFADLMAQVAHETVST